jgi:hypothetical protein
MTTNIAHRRRFKILSGLMMLLTGGAMITLALIADKLGYGDAGSFGVGQFLLLMAGLMLLLIGVLGKRFVNLYRGVAIIILNTLLLLAFLELGAIIVGKILFRTRQTHIASLPYYAGQNWAEVYWREAKQAQGVRYEPYVIWKHFPFAGKTVNYNQEGIRQTPGAHCSSDAYTVFTFGGSTMLGWGAPDWGTIAAYVQTELQDRMDKPVCVVNLAEDGYVSTQSLVVLMLQLQSGNTPDMVIFYDGINEVIAAYEAKKPSVHVTLTKIAGRFEQKERPLVTWGKGTRIYTFIQRWAGDLRQWGQRNSSDDSSQRGMENDAVELAAAVAETYFGNYKIVHALAEEYNFGYHFFLQPHLAVEGKPLTTDEQKMKSEIDPMLAVFAEAVYENIALRSRDYEYFRDLTDVFEKEASQIYIDDVGHITPEGNHLVAQEISRKIESRFAER